MPHATTHRSVSQHPDSVLTLTASGAAFRSLPPSSYKRCIDYWTGQLPYVAAVCSNASSGVQRVVVMLRARGSLMEVSREVTLACQVPEISELTLISNDPAVSARSIAEGCPLPLDPIGDEFSEQILRFRVR